MEAVFLLGYTSEGIFDREQSIWLAPNPDGNVTPKTGPSATANFFFQIVPVQTEEYPDLAIFKRELENLGIERDQVRNEPDQMRDEKDQVRKERDQIRDEGERVQCLYDQTKAGLNVLRSEPYRQMELLPEPEPRMDVEESTRFSYRFNLE